MGKKIGATKDSKESKDIHSSIFQKSKVKYRENKKNNKRFKPEKKGGRKIANKRVKSVKKSAKGLDKDIVEMENDKELFDDKGYYQVPKDDDIDESEWEDQPINTNTNNKNLASILSKMSEVSDENDRRLQEACKELGEILSKYRSGKLPKFFNILPQLENWEELILLCSPQNWTPQANFEATKLFASNLAAVLAEKFNKLVLLPNIRNDIKSNKKLNIHYYNCLKKSIFKPSSFFKGIIIPISINANSKEAAILGSILRKCSIPVLHSSAALMLLAQNGYHNGVLYFMKILISKKYALPLSVKEELVKYFLSFMNHQQKLTVLWHQTLLSFCQIYKLDLSQVEKEKLRKLVESHNHPQISEEILRELNYSKSDKKIMMID
jgi:essential nuclear protein 1